MRKLHRVNMLTIFLVVFTWAGAIPADAQGQHRRPGRDVIVEIDAARLYEIWEARQRAGHAWSERRSSARILGDPSMPLFHCGAEESLIVTAGRIAASGRIPDFGAPHTSCRAGEALFAETGGEVFCAPFGRPSGPVPVGPSEIVIGDHGQVVLLGECTDRAGRLTPAHVLADRRAGRDCVDSGSSVRIGGRTTAGACTD